MQLTASGCVNLEGELSCLAALDQEGMPTLRRGPSAHTHTHTHVQACALSTHYNSPLLEGLQGGRVGEFVGDLVAVVGQVLRHQRPGDILQLGVTALMTRAWQAAAAGGVE